LQITTKKKRKKDNETATIARRLRIIKTLTCDHLCSAIMLSSVTKDYFRACPGVDFFFIFQSKRRANKKEKKRIDRYAWILRYRTKNV